LSTASDAGAHVDHAARPEVRVPELLLARPHELHRSLRRARKTRRFDRALAGVLAA